MPRWRSHPFLDGTKRALPSPRTARPLLFKALLRRIRRQYFLGNMSSTATVHDSLSVTLQTRSHRPNKGHGRKHIRSAHKHSLKNKIFSCVRRFTPDDPRRKFRKFKVALNSMYRIFLNFAKSCILSCLSKFYNNKKIHRAVFEI